MGNSRRRVVFITGGMSGIGHYLAGMYADEGCDVALFDLSVNDARLKEIEARCKVLGQCARAWRADVCDAAGTRAAVDAAVAELGAPDLVINSAGVQRAGEFLKQSAEDYELVIRVNLNGSRNVAAATLPHMRTGGQLAFLASMAGLTANYSYTAYCASKWGVVGLASVLRIEMKPKGIDISVICPPEIPTPMVEQELLTMHPVARALKDFAGVVSLEDACAEIKAGLDKRRFRIIPGSKARFTYLLARFLPDFFLQGITDSKVRKILAQHPGL